MMTKFVARTLSGGRGALLLALLLSATTGLLGQGSSGAITGIVTDSSLARLPGASIEVTNTDTGVTLTATTGEAGDYTIPLLQPGRYGLTARLEGFRASSQSGIVIELGRTTRLDISLEVGEVTETVEVTADVPLLESETSTVGQFIENKTVTDMRSVDIYSHRLALESGITVPQLSCLTRILESGPMPLKALARAVDLSASTTVGIVDRLEKKGLVTRVRSIRDRREVEIAATEEGRIVAAGSPSLLHDRLAGALDTLPERERAAIAMSLERIVELMALVSAEQLGSAPPYPHRPPADRT